MGEDSQVNTFVGHVVEKYSKMIKEVRMTTSTTSKAKYEPLSKTDEEAVSDNIHSDDGKTIHESYHGYSCFQLLMGWICMALAILAGASIGPVFKYMMNEGIPPLLASSWRNQTMVLALIPMAIWEYVSSPDAKVDWFAYKPDLPYPVFVHVIISGISWASNLLCWVVGLQYISTFKASIVASSHPVLLVVAMQFSGHSVSAAEWIGVIISFGGMFLSEYRGKDDPSDATDSVPWKWQLYGYVLCLLAAAGEVVTILNRIKTRKYVPLMQYTLVTSVFVMFCATFLAIIFENSLIVEDGFLSTSDRGLFGWVTEKWRLKMVLFGLWVGAVCITGFNYAMQYIPPLVFASVTLIDPAVTAIISWGFGIEHLPGLFSWLGGAVVIAGVAVISYGERQREASSHKEAVGDYAILLHANNAPAIADDGDSGIVKKEGDNRPDDDIEMVKCNAVNDVTT